MLVAPPVGVGAPDTRPAVVFGPTRTEGSLPMMSSIRRRADGGIELSISDRCYSEGFYLYTWATSGTSAPLKVALLQPGQYVAVGTDNLGAGSYELQFLGERGDYLLFRERTWFYDIVPETNQLVQVRTYEGNATPHR
jgi:hypothetical protein